MKLKEKLLFIEEQFGSIEKYLSIKVKINRERNPIFEMLEGKNISELTGLETDSRNRFRELVRIRDNHTCQICGKGWQEGERRLDTHHIYGGPEDSKEVNPDSDKMITLCHKCHYNIEYLEK